MDQKTFYNDKNVAKGGDIKPSLLSLFCGAGGLDIGFEKAGFKVEWSNDYDKSVLPSYRNYFKKTKVDERSISHIPKKDIPTNVLGVIGAPPCQSWSEAGSRRGINDERGKLFFEYFNVIKHVKPTFFVAENVHGLIHGRNKNAFDSIIEMFTKEGYNVAWKLLNARDYGVAQDRKRVFIVGYHKSLNKIFSFPTPLDERKTLKDAIGDLERLKVGKTQKVKNHENTESGYSSIFLSRNRVRAWNEQSFTILATDRHIPFHPQAPKMIKVAGQDIRVFPKGQEHKYRRLTVRECARIQSFPDDYIFLYNKIRDGYKMVGNAVPVRLSYHIAQKIMADIKGLRIEQAS